MTSVSLLLRSIAAAALVSCAAPACYAGLSGSWRIHPGANLSSIRWQSHVYRIIDSPAATYFITRGLYLDRSQTGARTEVNSLFAYRKDREFTDGAVSPLSDRFPLSGVNVQLASYEPSLGALVVLYEEGTLDIIYDDGRFVSSPGIGDCRLPGQARTAASLSADPDGSAIYVCGNFGIVSVSPADGAVIDRLPLDIPVCWANRIGSSMVVIATPSIAYNAYAGKTYAFPAGTRPSTLAGLELQMQPVAGATMSGGTLSAPQQVLPLTDSSYLTITGASTSLTAHVVTLTDAGTAVCTPLGAVASSWTNGETYNNYRHLFLTESLVTASAGSYFIGLQGSPVIVARGIDPDTEAADSDRIASFKAAAVSMPARPADMSDKEKNSLYSSCGDGRVWFYAPYEGFYFRTLGADGAWGAPSAAVAPDAPGTAIAHELEWHPGLGMLACGPGSRPEYQMMAGDYNGLAAFRDGRWTPLAYARDAASLSTSATLTGMQKFLAVDPANTDWVWSVNYLNGIVRSNVADRSDFLFLGRKNATAAQKAVPGFVPMFDNNHAVYPTLNNFSNASFSADGTMWFVKDRVFDWDDIHEYYEKNYVEVMYYTAEERLAMQASATADIPYPHILQVPHACSDRHGQLLALKAPGNENRLLYESGLYYNNRTRQMAFILDHNGTPDDTSDDRTVFLEDLADERGEIKFNSMYASLWEDPESGEIWFNTLEGPMIIRPDDLFAGEMKGRRVVPQPADGGAPVPLDQIWVSRVAADAAGRRWVATRSGLFCLSSDARTLLGHWDKTNSPLPSDNVVSVAVDPATGSVFAATDRALCEFTPEGSIGGAGHSAATVSVWPREIRPDYLGHVSLSGLSDASEYLLVDESGEAVLTLPRPEEGAVSFEPRGADGLRLPYGRYSVVPASDTSLSLATVIML